MGVAGGEARCKKLQANYVPVAKLEISLSFHLVNAVTLLLVNSVMMVRNAMESRQKQCHDIFLGLVPFLLLSCHLDKLL